MLVSAVLGDALTTKNAPVAIVPAIPSEAKRFIRCPIICVSGQMRWEPTDRQAYSISVELVLKNQNRHSME